MADEPERITLQAGRASAAIALRGAEPVAWRIAGRDLLWGGDPAHWGYSAPILFPVVGASAGGAVRVDGTAYPMPQHGFARTSPFTLVESSADSAHLRLVATEETRRHYPFSFQLDVLATLNRDSLSLACSVTNTDATTLPYGLGFHPAFPWPFAASDRTGHRVAFEAAERTAVPGVSPDALLVPDGRTVPLAGRDLPLDPDMFSEALVFLEARSRSMRFVAPSGAAITLAAEALPHLAIWTKPTAPFLSLEAWTGHADWAGFSGELTERASILLLRPGETGRHAITMSYAGG